MEFVETVEALEMLPGEEAEGLVGCTYTCAVTCSITYEDQS